MDLHRTSRPAPQLLREPRFEQRQLPGVILDVLAQILKGRVLLLQLRLQPRDAVLDFVNSAADGLGKSGGRILCGFKQGNGPGKHLDFAAGEGPIGFLHGSRRFLHRQKDLLPVPIQHLAAQRFQVHGFLPDVHRQVFHALNKLFPPILQVLFLR